MWEADHTWVFYIAGEGMYCKLCRKFDTKNCQNQAKVWNTEPCTTLRKYVLARHEVSAMHKEGGKARAQIVKARGSIREAVQGQVALQKSAVIGAMKFLYWLCKQEIAHTTTYQSLSSLANIITFWFGGGEGGGGTCFQTPTISEYISNTTLHVLFYSGKNSVTVYCRSGKF